MSIERIHLSKLLKALYSKENKQRRLLLNDIRQEQKKEQGSNDEGGDFYIPFWRDAKDHVAGEKDLDAQTAIRIESNPGRIRLYPLLRDGFLLWWEKCDWYDKKFTIILDSIKAKYPVTDSNGVIKIENILALKFEDDSYQIIYPYFCEEPSLSEEAARLGLWLLGEALPDYGIADLIILDVFRGESFSAATCPLKGNEGILLAKKYQHLLEKWQDLK